jgi:hypothetical protein
MTILTFPPARSRSGVLCAFLAALVAPPAASANLIPSAPAAPDAVSQLATAEEAMIALEPDADGEALIRAAGGRLVSPQLRIWALSGRAAARLVPQLDRAGALRYAERAYRRPASLLYSDPFATPELGYHLYAVAAHAAEQPGPGFPLSVLDSGLDVANPDFAGRPDVVQLNTQRIAGATGSEYHGTSVSAVAAAATNGVGTEGVYPQVAIRSFDLGATASDPAIVSGITAAVNAGPSVINLSVGGPFATNALYEATLWAVGRGSLVVAAAGNDLASRNRRFYPASYPHVLTVGSVGRTGEPSSFSTSNTAVDIAAPGEEIAVALPDGTQSLVTGTSFAAPAVAAAAAWVRTVRGPMQPTQLADLLRLSARDIGDAGFDPRTGFGVLDIPAALALAMPAVDPQEPNDDVFHVVPDGLFEEGKRPVAARFQARVDVNEDPGDVYRVHVGARRQVTVVVTPEDDVRAALLSPVARTVAARNTTLTVADRPGNAAERLVYTNRTQRPAIVFLYVEPGERGARNSRPYTVSITRTPARR